MGTGVRTGFAILAVLVGLRGASAEPPSGGAAPPAESPDVAEARAKDLAAYEAEKEALERESAGRWVVIAGGKVAAIGKALADVAAVEHEAAHRFVFRVGDEGDAEEFISTWYAARFAGGAFLRALDLTMEWGATGSGLTKDGVTVATHGVSPFPRIRVNLANPGGEVSALAESRPPEVFVGTVGPELMLTPDDAVALRLERWEVPGTQWFFGRDLPCRRVLVTVSIRGIPGEATLKACYPTVPRERLVALQRGRDMFWQWGGGGPIAQMPLAGIPEGDWIVFGNDRVLGHAKTPEEAVTAADAETEFAYHRFALRIPHDVPPPLIPVGGQAPEPIAFDLRKFAETSAALNGRRVEARVFGTDTPVYVVSPEVAAAMHLERTESPYRFRLFDTDDAKAPARYARGGQAWTDLPVLRDGKPAGTRRGLALVLYERPKDAGDDPIEWPTDLGPGMR